ncbi:hypothetical protein HK098_003847 [Nowakowskiella sp. JEL0407]|nr:hypothetical protein HK098_003847 [Nowakowskiella sp. JEL0407]
MADLLTINYAVAISVVVLFGIIALILSVTLGKRHPDTLDFFLTARGSLPAIVIAFSFYASSMGAWAIFSFPAYLITAGIIGLIFYALACGIPIVIIAHVGSYIQSKYPNILSLGDFVHRRYGKFMQVYVCLFMLFQMSIGLAAEFTSVGNLFELVLGGSRLPVMITVAVVTSIYTAVGGLYVSMLTDVPQGISAITILLIVAGYIIANFRPSLPATLPDVLLPNALGYASIATMPISLTCATVFGEGFWQRVWASADDKALKIGAYVGALAITISCFLFGFGGFLAIWAGYKLSDPLGSTAFFDLLALGQSSAPVWIMVLVCLCTVIMNVSAVDTQQTAITNTLSAFLLSGLPVWVSRIVVVLINVVIVIVALQAPNVLSLFLIGNVLSCISALPILFGLWSRIDTYLSQWSALFGIFFAFWAVAIYGTITQGGLGEGLYFVFFVSYDWPTFVIAPIASVVGMVIGIGAEMVIRKSFKMQWPLPPSVTQFTAVRTDKLEAEAEIGSASA